MTKREEREREFATAVTDLMRQHGVHGMVAAALFLPEGDGDTKDGVVAAIALPGGTGDSADGHRVYALSRIMAALDDKATELVQAILDGGSPELRADFERLISRGNNKAEYLQ